MAVYLGQVVQHLCDRSYEDLKSLVEEFSVADVENDERKEKLKQYLVETRHQFVKLLVLTTWATNNAGLVDKITDLTQTCFNAQEQVFQTCQAVKGSSGILQLARAPAYDVESAVEVLATGTYLRLPTSIAPRSTASRLDHRSYYLNETETMDKIEELILSRMLKTRLPRSYSGFKVSEGTLSCTVPNEFTVCLTLSGSSPDSPWVVLDLELYVRAATTKVTESLSGVDASAQARSNLQLSQKRKRNGTSSYRRDAAYSLRPKEEHAAYLLRLLQHRLMKTKSPFQDIYDLLHGFCVDLSVLTLAAQAEELSASAWSSYLSIEWTSKQLKVLHWHKSASFIVFVETRGNERRVCLELDPPLAGSASYFSRYLALESEHTSRRLVLDGSRERETQKHGRSVDGLCPAALNFESVLLKVLQAQAEAKLERLGTQLLEALDTERDRGITQIWMEVRDDVGACLVLELISHRQLVLTVDLRTGRFVPRLDRVRDSVREESETKHGESLLLLLSAVLNGHGSLRSVSSSVVPTIRRFVMMLMAEKVEESLHQEGVSSTRENPFKLDNSATNDAENRNAVYVDVGCFDCHDYCVEIAIDNKFEISYSILSKSSLFTAGNNEVLQRPLRDCHGSVKGLLSQARVGKQILHAEWLSKHVLRAAKGISVTTKLLQNKQTIEISSTVVETGSTCSIFNRILQHLKHNDSTNVAVFLQPLPDNDYLVWLENGSGPAKRAVSNVGLHGLIETKENAAITLKYSGISFFGKDGRYGLGILPLEEDLLGIASLAILRRALATSSVKDVLQSLSLSVGGDCSQISISSTLGWCCTIRFNSRREEFDIQSLPYSQWSEALAKFLDLNFHVFSRQSSAVARATAFVYALVNGVPLVRELAKSLAPKIDHVINSRQASQSNDSEAGAPAGKFRGKVGLSKTIEAQKASSEKGSRGLSLVVLSFDVLRLLVGELQVLDLRLSGGDVLVTGKGTRWDTAQKVLQGATNSFTDKTYKLHHAEVEALLPKLVDSLLP